MKSRYAFAAAAVALTVATLPGVAGAASYSAAMGGSRSTALTAPVESVVQTVQHYRGGHYGGRPYAGRPGPRFYGGGPGWGYRPWYRRPYYGTIIGGIALGSIIGVTAYGFAPARPRPDMCWYWADEIQSRGYWDYC